MGSNEQMVTVTGFDDLVEIAREQAECARRFLEEERKISWMLERIEDRQAGTGGDKWIKNKW